MVYTEEDGMLKAKNYRFFERSSHISAGAANCHPTYYDPYFGQDDELIFSAIPEQVDVRIMYLWNRCLRGAVAPSDVYARVDGQLTSPKGNLEVAYIQDTTSLFSNRKWHDRFLIIDKSSVFLVGGSLTYQRYDAKSFGIYELTDADDAGLVLERFEETWNAAVAAGFLIH